MDSEHKVDNEPGIKLLVEAKNGKGYLIMSNIYGSYNIVSDISFEENEMVKFSCPHCTGTLLSGDVCELCNAPMVTLVLEMGGKVSFCSRKGCQNHNVGFNDLTDALRKFYEEFGYLDKHHSTPDYIHLRKDQEPKKTEDDDAGKS